nr:hypothetical protein [uncultured Blautia sp.]
MERIDRKSRAVDQRIRSYKCEKGFNFVYGGRTGKNCAEEKSMNKMREYERGREDGLTLALRIVRQGGIEALEREISFRGITGIHTSLAAKDLDKASEKIKQMTLDTFTILSIAALHDAFGFGQTRCQRFMDKVAEGADLLMDDLATWPDYIRSIKEELGMELEIRWND